jgi:hypothetical protein
MHLYSGNRCGHVASSPVLELTRPIPPAYPRILQKAAGRLDEFYFRPSILPGLACTPTSQETRSERREAIVRFCRALLKFCDLATLRVGVRKGSDLQNVRVDTLAKHADLELRRAERVTAELAGAGFLTTIQQREFSPSQHTFRSIPAIKRLSAKLFAALGLTVALDLERRKAKGRLDKEVKSQPPAVPALADAVNTLVSQLTLASGHRAPMPPTDQDAEANRRRRWSELAVRIRAEHPDWSADQVRRAADAGT